MKNKLGRILNMNIGDTGERFVICEKHFQELNNKWNENGLIFIEEGKTDCACMQCEEENEVEITKADGCIFISGKLNKSLGEEIAKMTNKNVVLLGDSKITNSKFIKDYVKKEIEDTLKILLPEEVLESFDESNEISNEIGMTMNQRLGIQVWYKKYFLKDVKEKVKKLHNIRL